MKIHLYINLTITGEALVITVKAKDKDEADVILQGEVSNPKNYLYYGVIRKGKIERYK